MTYFYTNVQCWPQDAYFPVSSSVLHFSEVWKCGITQLSFLIPSSILLRSVEKSDKVGIMSHFFPSQEPFVIFHLVPHFSKVSKCGIV